jgi:N-acetyl-gamma-glutamylphosphate reductase
MLKAAGIRTQSGVIAETTAEVLAGHDVVILALPHGASGALAAEIAFTIERSFGDLAARCVLALGCYTICFRYTQCCDAISDL